MAGLVPLAADVARRGATIAVIGNGTPDALAPFRAATGYTGTLLTDPSLAAFEAAGLASGLGTLLNVGAVVNTFRSLLAGTMPGRPSGSAVQQGGTFVLGPGNVARYAWRDRFNGDHAPLADVLAAL